MLAAAKAFEGCEIAAVDGSIGVVSDLLFDDRSWRLRWVVVDAGSWWTDHKVLLQPSAITRCDHEQRVLFVNLTMAKVKCSPELMQDPPVSRQMEASLYEHYGWDPAWGAFGVFSDGIIPMPFGLTGALEPAAARALKNGGDGDGAGDPHLRSVRAVTGAHIHATDGDIGHVQDVLFDEANWGIRYLCCRPLKTGQILLG